jgi:HSP20 family protein
MPGKMMQPYEQQDELALWPFSEWTRSLFPSFRGTISSTDLSVWEDKEDVVIEAPLPGIKPEEVELNYEKGILTISADKKEEKEEKDKKYYHKSSSSFVYHLSVPGELDESTEPQAKLTNGVLQVLFKKQKRTTPKKIQVQGE